MKRKRIAHPCFLEVDFGKKQYRIFSKIEEKLEHIHEEGPIHPGQQIPLPSRCFNHVIVKP